MIYFYRKKCSWEHLCSGYRLCAKAKVPFCLQGHFKRVSKRHSERCTYRCGKATCRADADVLYTAWIWPWMRMAWNDVFKIKCPYLPKKITGPEKAVAWFRSKAFRGARYSATREIREILPPDCARERYKPHGAKRYAMRILYPLIYKTKRASGKRRHSIVCVCSVWQPETKSPLTVKETSIK